MRILKLLTTIVKSYNSDRIYQKQVGTGGRTSSKLDKKPQFTAPVPIAGAYAKRSIPLSEFRL